MRALRLLLMLAGTFLPSPLRVLLWRMLGHRVGRHCRVSMFSIVVADQIEFGRGVIIEPLTLIYCPHKLAVGERCRIAGFVRIIGYGGNVELQSQTFVGLGCLIDCSHGFFLGQRSCVAPRCTIYSHGATALIFNARFPQRFGAVRIGSDVWIGLAVVIHPGVTVGDRVIVMPGLTLRRNVESAQAVLPPVLDVRTAPIERLLTNVTEETRWQAVLDIWEKMPALVGGEFAEQSEPDLRRICFRGMRQMILRRYDPKSPPVEPAGTIIWQLGRPSVVSPDAVVFSFEELVVYGRLDGVSEQVAQILASNFGAFFLTEKAVA